MKALFLKNAAEISFDDICEGLKHSVSYQVQSSTVDQFIKLFRDESPLHVDETYARANQFEGPIAHGAILNGFISHFIGMVFPGKKALLLRVDLRYQRPFYAGDRLELKSTVTNRSEATRVLTLNVSFMRSKESESIAIGQILVKVREQ